MYGLIRALLFQLPPELAHDLVLHSLQWVPECWFKKPPFNPVIVMGLSFPHRLGLAAGLDKNGAYLRGLSKLGFAFLEIGTITPRPQLGNPKPRLFRLSKAHALINRMGFNNQGVEALVEHVLQAKYSGILGINIGKNKETLLENAIDDYLFCLQKVYPLASYITINISSPNTPGLRLLQQDAYLLRLLRTLKDAQQRLASQYQRLVPLVVKVSPDEEEDVIKRMASQIVQAGIEGIITTNTTCSREAVAHLKNGTEEGGLSGRPLFQASTRCLRLIKSEVGEQVALIAAGGIDSQETAQEKLAAGASLLQVYTGLIYRGPGLVGEIVAKPRP